MRSLLLSLLLALPGSALAGTAWVSSNHIQVIDTDTARVVGRIPLEEFIHAMEFSPDGSRVYVGSSQGLRVADAAELTLGEVVAEGGVIALGVTGDGAHLVTLTKAADDASLAARKSGQPLPPSTVTVYDTATMEAVATWTVAGGTRDLVVAPDGSTVYVLHPVDGLVRTFSLDGVAGEEIDVAPIARDEHGKVAAIFSDMKLSPDGTRLVMPTTAETASSLVDVDLSGRRDQRVLVQDLGHRRRIQGVSWDEDGSGVYVSAVNNVVKFTEAGLPISWRSTAVNYVDIAPLRGTDTTVMVAPTFSSRRGAGGVSIVSDDGTVLRTVELPDMSPFHVAVAPPAAD